MPLIGPRGTPVAFLVRPVDYLQRVHRSRHSHARASRYVLVFTPDHIGHLLGDTGTFQQPGRPLAYRDQIIALAERHVDGRLSARSATFTTTCGG